jgi:hypothetical protein
VAVTLTDEQFEALMVYLEREYRECGDPDYIGETVGLGEKLWVEMCRVVEAQDFDYKGVGV